MHLQTQSPRIHADIRRELAARFAAVREDARLPLPLRPYQQETLRSGQAWLEDPSGRRRAYVQHATGLGKTITFASAIRHCEGLRILIIVPSKTLIAQTAIVLSRYLGGFVGHLSSMREIHDREGNVCAIRGHAYQSVVVTTDNTLKLKAAEIARDFAPDLIIRDECHWGYSESSQNALAHFPEAVVIGFSATPDYLGTVAKPSYLPVTLESGQTLYGDPNRFANAHFGERLDVRSARWGMENGFLCELAWAQISLAASLDQVRIKDGPGGLDYDEASLQRLLREHWPATIDAIQRLYADAEIGLGNRQAIAICPGVIAAQDLAHAMKGIVPSACVTGDTPDPERRRILRAYEKREIRFLSFVLALREGWDSPEAEVAFMLRVTRSRVYYEQVIGRILRPFPDGRAKVALAVDLHAQKATFGPLSAPIIYGKPGEALQERDVIVRRASPSNAPLPNSPYLPDGVNPKLVVVPMLDVEHWAGPNDTFEADGSLWASEDALLGMFKITLRAFWNRVLANRQTVRGRRGKDARGQVGQFFRVSDIERLFGSPAMVFSPPKS